jgi:transaldolase/glucose-6-phosphate isomerase
VVGEPAANPASYPDDRAFVVMTLAGEADPALASLAGELTRLGHPVWQLQLTDALDVGAEFVRWEVATAAAGMVLGIDPFDQPNVQESKDATRTLLDAYRSRGALPVPPPLVAEPGMAAFGDPRALGDAPVTVDGALRALLATVQPGDYVAILAYLPADRAGAALQRGRVALRDRLGVATTLGFGPRFLHSTGQLHKGGPPSGVFLQLTDEPQRDLPIPGWQESFGTLIAAQALGDFQSLQQRGRRVLRLHLDDLEAGLARVEAIIGG